MAPAVQKNELFYVTDKAVAGQTSPRCLDAAIHLTQKRDPQALAVALIEVLRGYVRAERLGLFALSNPGRDAEFSDANLRDTVVHDLLDPERSAPRPIAEDEDLLACVRTQRRVLRDPAGGGRRLVLPIIGARYVTALLVIDGLQEIGCDDQVLDKLLRVYSNQATLLNRNEVDALTGLYNRQSFGERLKKVALGVEFQNRRRAENARQYCFALLDIDHFKQVNDKYGHLYGDEVLLLLARLMARSFRHEDMMFRYGGEEFAVLLAGAGLDDAVRVLERFRGTVQAYPFPQIGSKTVSIGVTGISGGDAVDTMVARADKALYYAKNNGRNRVFCYEQLVAEKKIEAATVTTGDVEIF